MRSTYGTQGVFRVEYKQLIGLVHGDDLLVAGGLDGWMES